MSSHPALFALLFSPFTVITAWSLIRAWRTGKISSRGWTFAVKENSLGFWFVALCDFGILCFGFVLILNALALI
jgi:hypothetical protein